MKKLLLALCLVGSSTHPYSLEEIRQIVAQKILTRIFNQAEPEKAPIKPKVALISLPNQLNFRATEFDLIDMAKNNEIAAIIFLVDNSGGAASDFAALHDLIARIKKTKPVVALVNGVAFSAGYKVISPANCIIAHSGSSIGSIGAYMEIRRFKNTKLNGDLKADMESELFSAGEYKALWHPYAKELTDEQRAYIENELDKLYESFVQSVAENRDLSKENSDEWAQGKVFQAPEALALGLIDEIGTYFDAETKILELLRQRSPDVIYDNEITPVVIAPKLITNSDKN